MSELIKLKELLHLDVPLALVELHYEQEATSEVPWAQERFKIKPYILHERKDSQDYFYYDPKGIEWQIKQAGLYKDEAGAIRKLKIAYDKIKDIIENEKLLNKKEFLSFVNGIREMWPWINYMWWAIEYKEKNGKNFDELMKIRKYTEYIMPGMTKVFKDSIRKNYPESGEYADFILLREIENDNVPDLGILKKRKAYAYTDYKLYNSIDEIKDYKFEFENIIESEDLKGQVAFPGNVKGIVRIVSKREDITDFKEGEIIVSSTTTPDYLPAMKKAAAIISEHGGVICHAAISSRELKIPCVVGVKGATRILKTGDLIEIDKGEIRIIK